MNEPPVPFRSHTALLLSTALPFLQPAYRHPVELAMKFLEFSETLRLYQEFHLSHRAIPPEPPSKPESGFFGFLNTFILDLEGLLQSLSKVCTGDEKEIIGMFLNLIRARKFYETYGDLLNTLIQDGGLDNLSGGAGGDLLSSLSLLNPDLSSARNDDENGNSSSPSSYIDSLTSLLTDEQKETLELLKTLFTMDTEQSDSSTQA